MKFAFSSFKNYVYWKVAYQFLSLHNYNKR